MCDVYGALTSARPYKPAWPIDEARDELRSLRGRHLDPTLVDLFLDVVEPVSPGVIVSGLIGTPDIPLGP